MANNLFDPPISWTAKPSVAFVLYLSWLVLVNWDKELCKVEQFCCKVLYRGAHASLILLSSKRCAWFWRRKWHRRPYTSHLRLTSIKPRSLSAPKPASFVLSALATATSNVYWRHFSHAPIKTPFFLCPALAMKESGGDSTVQEFRSPITSAWGPFARS